MKVKHTEKLKKSINQPAWWDNECNTAKLHEYSLLRKFRHTDHRYLGLLFKLFSKAHTCTFFSKLTIIFFVIFLSFSAIVVTVQN